MAENRNNIYLDNAATTFPNKDVVALYCELETKAFGNSGSIHKLGMNSLNYLNKARESILNSFGVKNYKVYFTSSSTEANNLAIKGYCYKYSNRGKRIITSNVEHPSVLETFKALEQEGFEVIYLPVNKDGVIEIDDLKNAMNEETILVSVMVVNNEIGSINPIKEISEVVHKFPKANLHVDTTQAIGKIPFNYNDADMFVISGHKIHGLKGCGALIAKQNISFMPLINGGGQEDGFRSGTVAVAHACALAKALKIEMEKTTNVDALHACLINELKTIDGVELNSPENSSKYIVNFSLTKKKASVVVEALSNEGIFVSSVSACNSKKEPLSLTVKKIGKNDVLAHNTIRVSLDDENTLEEIKIFTSELKKILESIK